MAKIKQKRRMRMFHTREIRPIVSVTAHVGTAGFRACVVMKRGHGAVACESGKNPREAVGKAMAKAGKFIKLRRGVFEGFRR